MNELVYQSERRLEMLKGRTKRCVCRYCGNNLILKKIVFSEHEDSRVEIFCESCDRIEFGVEKEIYLFRCMITNGRAIGSGSASRGAGWGLSHFVIR